MTFCYGIASTQAERDEPFYRMRDEGLLPFAMSTVEHPTLELWRSITHPDNGHLVRCSLENGRLAACVLLSPFRGRVWEFDFTTFRETARLAVPMAHGLFRWAFSKLDCTALTGFCPLPNRHAWRLAEACGFQKLGILPQAAWWPRRKCFVDAVQVLATPASLARSLAQRHDI